MTGGHQGHIAGTGVVDRNEFRHQVPVGIDHGKVLLVFPHGRNEYLPGNFQKFGFKTSGGGNRVFHEVGNDIHQFRVFQDGPPGSSGFGGNLFGHHGLALGDIHDNPGLPQGVAVLIGVLELYFLRMHETVTPRVPAALHIADCKRQHPIAQKCHDGMQRTGKGYIEVHPAHGFRKRRAEDYPRQNLLENRSRGDPSFNFFRKKVGAFVRLPGLEPVDLDPDFLCEFFSGHGRLAVVIKSDLGGRPEHFVGHRFLFSGHVRHHNRQTPRGTIGVDVTVIDSCFFQLSCQGFRQGLESGFDIPGRNFFSPDFK